MRFVGSRGGPSGQLPEFHGLSSVSFFFAHVAALFWEGEPGVRAYERQSCGWAADFGLVADLTVVSKKPPGPSRLLTAGRR
jgi:hypothetical protein